MKKYLKFAIIICAFLLTQAASWAAQPSAVDLLKKSYAAESRATLSGRLRTTLYLGRLSPSAEVDVSRTGRRSRMDYLAGPSSGLTIIDDGVSLIRLNASTRTASRMATPEAPEHLGLLLANYRPLLTGGGKIAGRTCYVLRLEPKYGGNPSKKLWLDKASLIALKTERYNSDGKLAMSTEYTAVDFSARPSPSLFAIPRGWKSVRLADELGGESPEAVRKAVGFTPIRPLYIPEGYSFDGYRVCNMCRARCTAGLRYTNGLNTISVFEREGECPRQGRRGRGWRGGRTDTRGGAGACIPIENPHARMLRTTAGGLTITLVGDIAETELQKMAESLK